MDSAQPGSSGRACEGKDALCRAMGTLFLQHRVDKLQGDVEKMQRKCKGETNRSGPCSWKGGWKAGCPSRTRRDGGQAQEAERQELSRCQEQHLRQMQRRQVSPPRRMSGAGQATRIVVADVSLLIYSLRTIHNWLKEGDCRVVIPQEALRTLDVLKKGEHYLNLAARKATRFLDERFMCESAEQQDLVDMAPGLVAQRECEKTTCAEWKSLEKVLHDGNDQACSFPTDDDIRQLSHSARETLACSLYFMRKYSLDPSSSGPAFSLALALPPPHLDCSEGADGASGQSIKYGQRADGSILLQWARRLGWGDDHSPAGNRLIVAPTAASWLTANESSRTCR